MNITVEKLPDCKAAIRVEVPREKVESQRAQITQVYYRQAAIPGFRPGKAPAAMVARRYARQIEEELRERLIGEGYREGSKQEGLDVLRPTDVKGPTFNVDGSFTFTVEVITAPEFELPVYQGIPVRLPKAAITDANVSQAIENLRERLADYTPIDNRGVEEGDVAVVEYHGFIDGKPIREFAPQAPDEIYHAHDRWVRVREPSFVPGFSSGLIGMQIGESRPVNVTLPEDFPVKEIAGMEVIYEVELKELKQQILPELDDEFARKTKLADDAEALRTVVRERLDEDLQKKLDQIARQQIIGYLNKAVTVDLPEELIDQATQRRVQELVEENQGRGLSDQEIIEHQEDILAAASEQAQFDVKTIFILGKIAGKEGIKAEPQEVTTEITLYALGAGRNKQQMAKLLKNTTIKDRFRENIITRKTIELLRAKATVEEVEMAQDPSGSVLS
ncbi:MAG: trigger factor [Verrucomicrobiales bacterium]